MMECNAVEFDNVKTMLTIFKQCCLNNVDDTTGADLWNQWCERKANAMDFHQNEVRS